MEELLTLLKKDLKLAFELGRAAERERIRKGVEGLYTYQNYDNDQEEEGPEMVERQAVLDLLTDQPHD